ncbi:winged helix-turn-helix domain-containing protein [Streptomyces sp. NPDC048361]|uniref:winged helix-turn-helix domain-containing protein n=1 Tax=Streptomyces sp. NPDC048361 TaxID=3154720 RepID=UPI00343FAF5D
MLRVHFTDRDLARVHVAKAPDPLWETVLGLQQLAQPVHGPVVYADWRRRAHAEVTERRLQEQARLLVTLAPPGVDYFPDFLTPGAAADGLRCGLAALRSTPPRQLRQEVPRAPRLSGPGTPPRWARELSSGDQLRLSELSDAIWSLHDVLVAPDWAHTAATVAADRALRIRALDVGGVHGLLDSLRPVLDWRPPVLSGPYPVDLDIQLGGRGLRLIPSHFCWRTPVALVDASLDPVLVYPIEHPMPSPGATAGQCRHHVLAALLGRTRAGVLAGLDRTATTGELACRLRISPASASEHVRALRDAGLAVSIRAGGRVIHILTPLGNTLLAGDGTTSSQ